MGVLTGPEIRAAMARGDVVIDPEPQYIGPNSVDLTLAPELLVYAGRQADGRWFDEPTREHPLDMREPYSTTKIEIPEHGLVLVPGVLYLGCTVERTYTPFHVPYIGGRSSVGRLGIQVHSTAGFGDLGFSGKWTLELSVTHHVRVYAGVRFCQIWFFEPSGELEQYEGRYQDQEGVTPSRMHEPDRRHSASRCAWDGVGVCPSCGEDVGRVL